MKKPSASINDERELSSPFHFEPQRFGASPHGMVAAQHWAATEAGVRILREGGNAMDAAVATAFALGVCEPAASGLGGQTMMMVHSRKTGKTFALDGSSRAPNRAIPGSLSSAEIRRGYKATTVPSTPATLGYALKRYGKLDLPTVLAPSIELAENGYPVSQLQHALTKRERKALRGGTAGPFFLKDGKTVFPAGHTFRQPALAQTLRRLAKAGTDDFYTGRIARAIHADMVKNEGLIRKDDLAQIPRPIERRPLAGWFLGRRVMTMPPSGAGRMLIELMNILSHLPEKRRRIDTPMGALYLAETVRRAVMDRTDRPFDPNYYAQINTKRMLSDEYAKKCVKEIDRRVRTSGETTHLSVMDRDGNVVALTQSIERVYGSCAVTEDLGFLYNNYMMAFEHEDISHPYYLRPNAVPWASVAPTIVFEGRRPWLCIGSPGSERIAPAIAQVLLRLKKQSPFDAVSAPRLYCNLDRKVSLEASRMRTDVPELLEKYGFTIDRRDAYSFYLGCVQLVLREGDSFIGVADPRRDGAADGPRA